MAEGFLHQARIEQKLACGYTKNGFAAAVKELPFCGADADAGCDIIALLSVRPIRRPDAFFIDVETRTIRAVEVVQSHGIKDDKATWFARLHDELINGGWWLEVEIIDAVTGASTLIENPYECWGLLIILQSSEYNAKQGTNAAGWQHLRGMGLTP